ncbi:MAG: AAA family ATPase [Bdellovibrionia bacterium]
MTTSNFSQGKLSSSHWNQEGPKLIEQLQQAIRAVIYNKKKEAELALICFLAQGHLLIEDIPGMGKTTLVKALFQLLGLKFSRIQFTSDLLPSDILGTSIYRPNEGAFEIRKGPLFSELILADELNRANPKTQSALLQAMEERSITIDRETFFLSPLFFLVATQNPRSHLGTFPLPESQLDRFLMRIELGYPGESAETELIQRVARKDESEPLEPLMNQEQWIQTRAQVASITVCPAVASFIYQILRRSRQETDHRYALSTRSGIALAASAQAAAFLAGRNFVIPEDVQATAPSVLNHRIHGGERSTAESQKKILEWLHAIEIP